MVIVVEKDRELSCSYLCSPRVGCVFCAVAPVFTSLQAMQSSDEVSLSVGDSVRLRCDAVGRPRVEVQWFKDDKMLSASGPASTSSSSSSSVDDYDYRHASDGTSSSSRRVRHPYSRRHESGRRRRSGGQGDGVAGSRSRTAADLLLDNAEELYADDGDERLSLMLDSVTPDDAGLYTCRVFNKAGTVNFTYAVHVIGMTSYHVTELMGRVKLLRKKVRFSYLLSATCPLLDMLRQQIAESYLLPQ